MPWIKTPFRNIQADEKGEISFEKKAERLKLPNSIPSVQLLRYAVKIIKTTENDGFLDRKHETTLKVIESDEQGNPVDNGFKCQIGPFHISSDCEDSSDCKETVGEIDCDRVRSGYYNVFFISKGFTENEFVSGEAKLRYSVFVEKTLAHIESSNGILKSNWERKPEWEAELASNISKDFDGKFQEAYRWCDKIDCGRHGEYKNDYAQVWPNYDSLEIWVNWIEGRGHGYIHSDFYAQAHHKKYVCGKVAWEWQPNTRGWLKLDVHIDVSSGDANVTIEARWEIGDIGNVPDVADRAFRGVINNQLKKRFAQKKPEWENELEEIINGNKELVQQKINDRAVIKTSSIVEVLQMENILLHKQYYDIYLDYAIAKLTKDELKYLDDELNQEYIAGKINEQTFSTFIEQIDASNNIYFKDLDIALIPTVQVGQVRIITAPEIKIILDTAQFGNELQDGFVLYGKTNLFESGEIECHGKATLSFIHTYGRDKVENMHLYIQELIIKQAPGTSEYVRRQLNNKIDTELNEKGDVHMELASLLNDAIDDVLDNLKNIRYLTHNQFKEQIKETILLEYQE